jgi:hypothetical protein
LVARTREHHLEFGGETGVVTNALKRPQNMIVRALPIPSMIKAGICVVTGTITTHEVFLAAAFCIREWSENRIVGEPEILMEEGNIVLHRDCLSEARLIASV